MRSSITTTRLRRPAPDWPPLDGPEHHPYMGAQGRLAQLVEHSVHIAGVTGSNPVPPTIIRLVSFFERRFVGDEIAHSHRNLHPFCSDDCG